jgi:hypothetical protein
MPMLAFMTAAEIAAAEAAAVAAAEAAAVAAAEAAAITAAEQAAAAAAAEAAAAQAAQTTATSQAGIMGAQAAGAGPTTTGIMAQAAPAAEAAVAVGGPGAGSAGTQAAMEASMQSAGATPGGIATVPQAAGSTPLTTAGASPYALGAPSTAPGASSMQYGLTAPNSGLMSGAGMEGAGSGLSTSAGTGEGIKAGTNSLYQGSQPSALQKGWSSFSEFAKANPYTTAMGTYAAGNAMGAFDPNQQGFNDDPYDGPLSKYRLSPDFQGRQANPEDYQYTPQRYANGGITGVMQAPTNLNFVQAQQGMQSPPMPGGIASYKAGGSTSAVEYYTDMLGGERERQIAAMRTPAAGSRDVGIYRDSDPDTMYLDPMSAAQVRMAKINKRTNVRTPGMKRPTPMGQLNLQPSGAKAGSSSPDVESAAQGGIMQASGHLGGYAAGGQPRLLKGPGDGMSDNIPATIANKQPARLADGEFVIPADVVSHLGNGSTGAGAKKLHSMMDNVRKARTGRKAQGKQINPNRFMPK